MTGLVVREFNGKQIEQRESDGYMDATAMCKATGRKWAEYWRLTSTQEFVKELADSMGKTIESMLEAQTGRRGGTYVHPKLAMNLAQWCSPKFAVVVSGWVLDILTTGKAEVAQAPADPIMAVGEAIVLMRRAQIEHERKLATVEEKADRALQQSAAAQQTSERNYGWYSVLAFCKRIGRNLSVTESAKVGKALAEKLRAIGGQPQRVADPRFGFVNLYPESLLAEHFECGGLVY